MNESYQPINKRKTFRSRVKSKHRKSRRIFTKHHYKSGDGMLTSVWGPSMWHYLHTMSFNYPIHPSLEDKQNYRNFVLSLQNVLPCKYCRINLKKNFKQHPLKMSDMKDRDSFSRYIYQLHEIVNKMLEKKSNLSYEDVRDRYEHFRSRCKSPQQPVIEVKEKGCTDPLHGKKSKCIIKIVPQKHHGESFQMSV